jgi:ActR/RegA family two-component response regulator
VVTGSAINKQYLSATVGTWKSNPVAKTSTQWFRCEKATRATNAPVAKASDCTAIKGAKATRYRLVADDEGMFVTSQVTAVNTQGTAVVTASSPRVALTPSSTNSPVISGTAMLNKSLTASNGSWEAFPAPKTSVQWYRCGNDTSAGEKKFSGSSRCTPIRGATKNRYTVTAADKDKYISVLVTAVNTAGKTTVTAESAQVAYAPTKTANPSISGSASVDKTLTATPGRWSAFPEASTSFKWYRCSSPAAAGAEKFTGASGCSPIGGASGSRYTVTEADRGKYIAVLVKASNSAGSTSATSKSTAKVG